MWCGRDVCIRVSVYLDILVSDLVEDNWCDELGTGGQNKTCGQAHQCKLGRVRAIRTRGTNTIIQASHAGKLLQK